MEVDTVITNVCTQLFTKPEFVQSFLTEYANLMNMASERIISLEQEVKDKNFKIQFLEKSKNSLIERNLALEQYAPKHGSCCTCQVCGKHYDDCRCDERTLHEEIGALKFQLKQVQEKLDKYEDYR